MPHLPFRFPDRYQTRLAPPPMSLRERLGELARVAGEIAQAIDEASTHPALVDGRANDALIKVGALEVHLALAHGKANDIAVFLDGLKGD